MGTGGLEIHSTQVFQEEIRKPRLSKDLSQAEGLEKFLSSPLEKGGTHTYNRFINGGFHLSGTRGDEDALFC